MSHLLQTPSGGLALKCDNPSVFEACLYYIYGSHIRILRPPTVNGPHGDLGNGAPGTSSVASLESEVTPDTSFASVDENDLTAEYDRFAVSDPLHDFDKLEQVSALCGVNTSITVWLCVCRYRSLSAGVRQRRDPLRRN